jgi:hypothetical protein
MTKASIVRTRTLVVAAIAAIQAPVQAQGWFLDVGAGRFADHAVSANVQSDNLTGVVRYEGLRDTWVFGAAGAPLGGQDTLWGAAGAGARLVSPMRRTLAVGADLGLHGYSFRDAVAQQVGTGATVEAIPFVRLGAAGGTIDLRAGWRGHTLGSSGVRESRGVLESGVRAGYGLELRLEGEARVVHTDEGRYPFAGASLSYRASRLQLWGGGGRWLSDDLDEVSWGGGAAFSLGPRLTAWATVRREAPDPLYWNPTRRTWSIGLTHRFQRLPAPLAPVPRSVAGRVGIRMRAADAPDGPVSIAGDFNGWQPEAMTREGQDWVINLPLTPGVYHYAFRSANGTWFVPASTPGRRNDGMGGHVAVLVVS